MKLRIEYNLYVLICILLYSLADQKNYNLFAKTILANPDIFYPNENYYNNLILRVSEKISTNSNLRSIFEALENGTKTLEECCDAIRYSSDLLEDEREYLHLIFIFSDENS